MRAIHEGSISILQDHLRGLLLNANRAMGAANAALESRSFKPADWSEATNEAQRLTDEARGRITVARGQLLRFLSNEDSS